MKNRIRTEAAALWQIAWPVLIGQLATVGMGVSDVAMTGHLSAEELAAVSIGASLWSIILVTVMGTMMAVNAVIAHEVGANNLDKVPHTMRQAVWMGGGVGLIACLILNTATLIFNHLHIDPVVNQKASQFVHVISVGLPAFAIYRALYGYTTSLNETKPVMMIALGGLGFNIIINWIFIYGHLGMPQLGATGCAVATGLGLWLMLAAMLLWMRHADVYRTTYPFTRTEGPVWYEIRSMLKLGLPVGVWCGRSARRPLWCYPRLGQSDCAEFFIVGVYGAAEYRHCPHHPRWTGARRGRYPAGAFCVLGRGWYRARVCDHLCQFYYGVP